MLSLLHNFSADPITFLYILQGAGYFSSATLLARGIAHDKLAQFYLLFSVVHLGMAVCQIHGR
jgi:hypothetical protein